MKTAAYHLKLRHLAMLCVAQLALSASLAHAQTFQFQEGVSPTSGYQMGDTYVRQDTPATNLDGFGLYVGTSQNAANTAVHSLLTWDLSSLPDGLTLSSVSLTLQISSTDGISSASGNIVLEMRLLSSSFTETGVTWNTQPLYGTLLSSVTLDPQSVVQGQLVTWNSTPAFLAAAQAAADANLSLSFVLRATDAVEAGSSREAFFFYDDAGSNASTRPLLTISAVPEPGTTATFALGALAIAAASLRQLRSRRETAARRKR